MTAPKNKAARAFAQVVRVIAVKQFDSMFAMRPANEIGEKESGAGGELRHDRVSPRIRVD